MDGDTSIKSYCLTGEDSTEFDSVVMVSITNGFIRSCPVYTFYVLKFLIVSQSKC